jgi:hypothetical protein
MDEKNPEAALAEGELSGPFSGVGVKGASVMLESLLGPALPALPLRWEIILPSETPPFALAGEPPAASVEVRLLGDDWLLGWERSVGAGGVLTMIGAGFSPEGGVCGGREVSILPVLGGLDRRRSETLSFGTFGSSGDGSSLAGQAAADTSAALARPLLAAATGGADLWLSSPVGFLSGLGLPLSRLLRLVKLFFDLNTWRNLPTGEGDLLASFPGGARPVLLRLRRESESRESVRVVEKAAVDDLARGWSSKA